MEEFTASFHSLNGTTIGERRKSLFHLLERTRQSNHADFDFTLLHPQNSLEEQFKVDALIYFKRSSELMNMLRSENPALIDKVLKASPWILNEGLNQIAGEDLVTNIFPNVSFNTKVKLLNKLSKSLSHAQRADDYFRAVEKKYGSYLASKLLPACSSDLIMNSMQTRNKLTPRQLLMAIKKYPAITEAVIKELNKKGGLTADYNIVFTYLAENDTKLFLKLYKEYGLSVNLGRRLTNKFIGENKNEIIEKADFYYNVLHKKQIARSLQQDFQDFYMNLLPESLVQFENKFSTYDRLFTIIKTLGNANLLLSSFEKAYKTDFFNYPDLLTPELLDLIPSSVRYEKMKIERKPSTMSEEKWYSYLKTDQSIPFLKKAISLCSDIKSRADLIALLVETCKLNDDEAAFDSLCKFMLTKHRNDHISVRLAFFRAIRKRFKLEKLSEQQWASLNELIQLFELNDEQFHNSTDFLEGYIHYRLINNLPIDEQLQKWLKSRCGTFNVVKEKPEYEKVCLYKIGEMIPQSFKDSDLNAMYIQFLTAVMDWNKRHKDDYISLFDYPEAIAAVKHDLAENDYTYNIDPIVRYCVRNKNYGQKKDELVNQYLEKHMDIDIMKWLIRHEPLNLLKIIHRVKKLLSQLYYQRNDVFFWKHSKLYAHLEIPQKIITICLEVFQDEQEDEQENARKNSILALSFLMPNEEFKSFIAPYYPKMLRAESKSDEGQKLYKIQQNIGACLKNLLPTSTAIEVILNFCKGDYLKLIQSSLYSLSGNINEEKLPSFFNELAGRAVSTRKHALHLTFRVLSKKDIYNVVAKFMESEKNASIRKFIFKSIFNYFVLNPDDYLWELVKKNVDSVDVNDKEAIEILLQVGKIPQAYLVKYVLFTWEKLNKIPDSEGKIESKKGMLLQFLDHNIIQLLPVEFCEHLIDDYFFKISKGSLTYFQSIVQDFTLKYIIYSKSKDDQERRLLKNFNVIRDYISSSWNNRDIRSDARHCVSYFLRQFCEEFLSKSSTDIDILKKFSSLFNDCLKPHDYFEDFLYLHFTLMFVESLPFDKLAQRLDNLFSSLLKIYGASSIAFFAQMIDEFDKHFFQRPDEDATVNRFILIENLMKIDNSTNCSIMVILLLDKYDKYNGKTKDIYGKLMDVLEKKSDPVIHIYLHSHYKKML